MITLKKKGAYQLVGLKEGQKLLYLDGQGYVWTYAKGIGELLSFSKHTHKTQYVLAQGKFRVYSVEGESKFVDLQHLELDTGLGSWQGYLLLTGLPTPIKVRSRIVPTDEVISPQRKRRVS